ncbi:MAG: PQQ-binding-like beta-propeller repeat protein [Cellvibrionaceae bacterium]
MVRLSILISILILTACSQAEPNDNFTAEDLTILPTQNWLTNGGTVYNQRFSPLKQINTTNVKNLKGDWVTHLDGSGVGAPYSGEAQPIVYEGIIYIPTGANDVFALDADTGKHLWTYKAELNPDITTVCCGWTSRGVGLGEGKVFVGQLDGKLKALDQKTGKEMWTIQAERWEEGYTITSAPLYYDGMVITGFAGAEYATRGRVKAYSAKDGKLLWTFYTVPEPGEFGSETWPSDSDVWKHGGATVWQTPAVDPELGLLYFSTGNPGPDFNGSVRKGDNLFSVSMVAIDVNTGKYRWHFQQVHHDLWDYDSPSPVVLFDLEIDGKNRKGIAEIGKTGWVYILDRETGKPLIGIEEKPVMQEPRQLTSPTQPFPIGDPVVPHSIDIPPYGFELVNKGKIFTPYWTTPIVAKPSPWGGTNWPPSSYDPTQGYLFVCANDVMGKFVSGEVEEAESGKRYMGGRFGMTRIPVNGIFAAVDMRTNKIVWRQRWKDSCYSGSTATAGNLVFTGRNDGRFVAMNSSTGQVLWEFQTGAGVNATATIFEHKGEQRVVIYSAGNLFAGTPPGDSVWMFSLKGTLEEADTVGPITEESISMEGADAQNGGKIFKQYCAQCHGDEGRGGHGGGPDLSQLTTSASIINTAVNGKNTMPSFKEILKEEEIRDVVQHILENISTNSQKSKQSQNGKRQ